MPILHGTTISYVELFNRNSNPDTSNVWANTVAANSFVITLKNISGGNLGEALVLRFTVIKGVTA